MSHRVRIEVGGRACPGQHLRTLPRLHQAQLRCQFTASCARIEQRTAELAISRRTKDMGFGPARLLGKAGGLIQRPFIIGVHAFQQPDEDIRRPLGIRQPTMHDIDFKAERYRYPGEGVVGDVGQDERCQRVGVELPVDHVDSGPAEHRDIEVNVMSHDRTCPDQAADVRDQGVNRWTRRQVRFVYPG